MARAKRLSGINPLAYIGAEPNAPLQFAIENKKPTVNDYNNWNVGTIWLHNTTENVYMLVKKVNRVATWLPIGVGTTDLEKLTGDGSITVEPDASSNINILSGFSPLSVDGTPATNTLTINSNGTIATQYDDGASGSAIPAAGILEIVGGTGISTSASGNTVTVTSTSSSAGEVINFGMTVDTGGATITVHSQDGSALSALNPGFIRFPSKATPGTSVLISITANQSMLFSDIEFNVMGTVGGIDWPDDMPLYVYGVLNEAEDSVVFGLARVPHHNGSGLLANIGTPLTPNANSDMSFFLFSDVTIGDYDNTPVTLVGSIAGTKNAVAEWSFSTIEAGSTGVGYYQNAVEFTIPVTQVGADNNRIWSSSGTPVWDNSHYVYGISKEGFFSVDTALNNLTAIGTAAETFYLMVPVRPIDSSSLTGVLRSGGSFSASSKAVSAAANQGTHTPFVLPATLANGFYGIQFVKIEDKRLDSADFDTLTASNSTFTGYCSFQLGKNFIT